MPLSRQSIGVRRLLVLLVLGPECLLRFILHLLRLLCFSILCLLRLRVESREVAVVVDFVVPVYLLPQIVSLEARI